MRLTWRPSPHQRTPTNERVEQGAGTYGVSLHFGDGLRGVHLVRKHFVQLRKELGVVNHASAVSDLVAVNKFLDFLFVELDVEGAEAGAELIKVS